MPHAELCVRPIVLALLLTGGCSDDVTIHVSYMSSDRHPASQVTVLLGDRVIRGADLRGDASWGFPSASVEAFGPRAAVPIRIVVVAPPAETLVVASGSLETGDATEYRAEIYATQFGPGARLCFGPTLTRALNGPGPAAPDTLYVFWGEWPRPFVC